MVPVPHGYGTAGIGRLPVTVSLAVTILSVWFTCRIRSALHIRLVSPYSARLNAVYGEATRACNGMEWNGMEDGMEEEFWYGIWKTSGMERNGRF